MTPQRPPASPASPAPPDAPAPPPRPPSPALTDAQRASFRYCHRVTRREARNFYHGLRLTPEPKRSAMYAVYTFMRACDDLADQQAGEDPAQAARRIEAFRARAHAVLDPGANHAPAGDPASGDTLGGAWPHSAGAEGDPSAGAARADEKEPFWPAFHYVVRTYGIDAGYLDAMLDGQREDLRVTRYETFDELYAYCYKVASVVGLVCLQVWGYEGGSATRKLAEHRGIALQLTNILRDIAEDARRGRIYLPTEDLERFGYTEDDLLAGRANPAFDRLMSYQIERARGYYELAGGLERRVAADCRPTCWVMMRIYRDLLERIARKPRRVLRRRVSLSPLTKLTIGLRALTRRRGGTPGRG